MKPILRNTIAAVILLCVCGGLAWVFFAGHSAQAADADSDAPIEAPSRVAQDSGRTVLSFDADAQRDNGIVVNTLTAEDRAGTAQATAVVLQMQPFLDLKATYNAASMEISKARAAARASTMEYKRLEQLNSGSDNVSLKSVEAARAQAESDAAVLQNAQQTMAVLKDSMQLHWGGAVANWLQQGSPQLSELMAQRLYLLQVTATGGGNTRPPAYAMLQLPDGSHAPAHLISALPQVDLRLQAPSFLYTIAAHPGVTPGMNLSVALPAGPMRKGVVVPYSAIVWWQGNAWCYLEEKPDKFTREVVATGNPAPAGWFVSEGMPAGARVVTKGAQTLLSEEFRSQIQSDED